MFDLSEIQDVMASEINRGGGSKVQLDTLFTESGGFQFKDGRKPWGRRRARGHYNRHKVDAANKMLAMGHSIRKTASRVGMSKITVQKIRKEMQAVFDQIRCGCGRLARHSGTCGARRKQ